MKKNLNLLCIVGIVFSMLTGCGAGKNFENTAGASGAGVSGQAAGTETAEKKETSGEAEKTASEFSKLFYTDNFLYEQDGIHILQKTFDGKTVKKYTFPGKVKEDDIEMEDVSEEEIFYSIYEEDYIMELWSIPIERGQDNETLQMDKASKILTDDYTNYLDCNADYIAYTSGEGYQYKEYDRKEKKSVAIDKEHPKRKYYDAFSAYGSENGDCKKAMLLTAGGGQGWQELYVHKPGTGEVKKVAEDYYTKGSCLVIGKSEDKIFYTSVGTKSGSLNYDIWCYDCETEKNERYLTKKQLDKVSRMDGIEELHVWGDTLHIAGYTENSSEKHKVVSVSIETGQAKEEKELNKFLHSHNCYVETFDRDKCLMAEYDDDYASGSDEAYSFDMVTKKSKKIKSGDPEYTYWDMM